jgi:hypothetical protein
MMKPRFRMDRACQGALSGRILFWGRFSHGVAMGSRRSAPCGASDLAKAWAGFLNKAERLIHGVPIANNPENSDAWYQMSPLNELVRHAQHLQSAKLG